MVFAIRCAPAGPAGTGKTESVKDLSNALAKLVYVLNCSPDMDYKSLGAVWQGVSSSGAWICKQSRALTALVPCPSHRNHNYI